MKKIKKTIWIFFMTIFIVSCSTNGNSFIEEPTNDNKDESNQNFGEEIIPPVKVLTEEEILEEKIDRKIEKMTLREKIGQTLILGFNQRDMNEDLCFIIKDIKPSGFIYFDKNIKDKDQVISLNKSIYELNLDEGNIPLFISIDEEGGPVTRLSKIYGRLPNMAEVGKLDNENMTFLLGEILGLRLKSLGFNLNFAPVADINSNTSNTVIGNRSFGSTYDLVGRHSIKVMEGLHSKNIISTVKHFPGHGDTSVDSHFEVPVVSKTYEEIEKLELIPFIKAIENDIDIVMVGHILYEKIDDSNVSSMTSKIKEDILREDLMFQGVIASDDLTMKAALNGLSIEETVFKFLKTGGDLALVCHNTDEIDTIVAFIENKILDGELREKDLNLKIKRILKVKEKRELKDFYESNEEYEDNIYRLQEELNNELNR